MVRELMTTKLQRSNLEMKKLQENNHNHTCTVH